MSLLDVKGSEEGYKTAKFPFIYSRKQKKALKWLQYRSPIPAVCLFYFFLFFLFRWIHLASFIQLLFWDFVSRLRTSNADSAHSFCILTCAIPCVFRAVDEWLGQEQIS